MPRDESIIVEIVEAIAAAKGLEPLELTNPLYDYVDTNALAALDNHDGSDWELQFTVEGHWVTVDSTGTVDVEPKTP